MKKHIDKITWIVSGASAAILVISIWKKDPLLYAIAFIIALGCVFGYYMMKSPEEVVDICEGDTLSESEKSRIDYAVNKAYQENSEVYDQINKKDVMTNSEITAACIKTGILDPKDIAWIQDDPIPNRKNINESIQHVLTQKESK